MTVTNCKRTSQGVQYKQLRNYFANTCYYTFYELHMQVNVKNCARKLNHIKVLWLFGSLHKFLTVCSETLCYFIIRNKNIGILIKCTWSCISQNHMSPLTSNSEMNVRIALFTFNTFTVKNKMQRHDFWIINCKNYLPSFQDFVGPCFKRHSIRWRDSCIA